MPANTLDFFGFVNEIAAFEFYEGLSDDIYRVLDLETTEAFSEKFENLGYQSVLVLNNMGSMIFFFLGYPCFILL